MAALASSRISTSLVADTLKTSTHDVGQLCTNDNINKWSKHKPIRYPKVDGLSDAEFKGTTADQLAGIYYGLKSNVIATDYESLHQTTYEYVGKPTGGANAPYRLGDFRGYDHNAEPNLIGYPTFTDNTIYFDIQEPISILIDFDYQGKNTTGIDLSELTPSNDVYDIEDYYPCVMIDNWAKVLYNKQLTSGTVEQEPVVTRIYHNGVYYQNFATDLDVSDLQVEGKTHTVSFFLIRVINDTLINLNKWVDVKDKAFNQNLIAIPEATGMRCTFERWDKLYIPTPISVRATMSGGVTVAWGWTGDPPEEAMQVTCRVSTSMAEGGSFLASKTMTYTPPVIGGPVQLLQFNFTWREYGVLPLGVGDTYTHRFYVSTEDGGQTKEITFTVQ